MTTANPPHDLPPDLVPDLAPESLDDRLLWDRFFALRSMGGLRRFAAGLDPASPDHRALARYMATWAACTDPDAATFDPAAAFDPRAHVSADLSTALYAGAPCIFRGSNAWSTASVLPVGVHLPRLAALSRRIGMVRAANPQALVIVAVIPEKDYTLNRMFVRDGRLDGLTASATALRTMLHDQGIAVIFDDYLDGLARYQTPQDYAYPDSHLPTANYLQVMSHVMRLAGIPWAGLRDRLRIETGGEYCDLNDRLTGLAANPVPFAMPDIAASDVHLADGDATFRTPLGDTRQILHNARPADPRSLLILGDSHSSIYAKRKLTHLCANVFATTEFHWNPCGFRTEVGPVAHPVIMMEVAQRFLYAVA